MNCETLGIDTGREFCVWNVCRTHKLFFSAMTWLFLQEIMSYFYLWKLIFFVLGLFSGMGQQWHISDGLKNPSVELSEHIHNTSISIEHTNTHTCTTRAHTHTHHTHADVVCVRTCVAHTNHTQVHTNMHAPSRARMQASAFVLYYLSSLWHQLELHSRAGSSVFSIPISCAAFTIWQDMWP